ncbi:MAG: membrane protein insertase YidC, partial [Pseudanabaena sp.]
AKTEPKSITSSKSESSKIPCDAKAKKAPVVDDKDKDGKTPTKSALPFEPNSNSSKKKKKS